MNNWSFDAVSFIFGYFLAAILSLGSMIFFKWLFIKEANNENKTLF